MNIVPERFNVASMTIVSSTACFILYPYKYLGTRVDYSLPGSTQYALQKHDIFLFYLHMCMEIKS